MYSVSTKFLKTSRTSTKRISVVDIYYNNLIIYSDIPIKEGTINVDRSSSIRRSGNLVVSKANINTDLLEPWGTEIRVRSGVQYTDRTREMVPLGIFRIEDIAWNEGQDSDITVNFFDRGKALEDAGLLADRDVSGKTALEAIQLAITSVWDHAGYTPTVTMDSTLNNVKLPKGSIHSGTYLDLVQKSAEATSGEVYFDVLGNVIVGKIPAITPELNIEDAVWVIDVGESGVLIEATRKHSRSETFNAVAVYGATKNTTGGDRVSSIAYDLSSRNNASYFSAFGKKSKRMENDALTTDIQCQQVAQQQLKNFAGLSKTVEFTSLLNPALAEGDIIAFKFLDDTTEIHLVDSLSIPLGSGEMTGQTRSAQYVE